MKRIERRVAVKGLDERVATHSATRTLSIDIEEEKILTV
jgi:hypothetical protein